MTTVRRALLVAMFALAACAPAYTGGSRVVTAQTLRRDERWRLVEVAPVRQRELADCGAAALAMVISRWRPGLDRVTIMSSTRLVSDGYRLGDLRDLARRAGLRAFAIVGDREVLAYELGRGRPVVIGLHRPYGKQVRSHYEVVVGLHPDGRVATIDPGDAAWHVRSWADLTAEWHPAGRPALVVLGEQVRESSARNGATEVSATGRRALPSRYDDAN